MTRLLKLYCIVCLLLLVVNAKAQNKMSDSERIFIHPVIPTCEYLPSEAAKLLETKLSQIITANGISDNECGERFILTAKINVLSNDIVAGPPIKISLQLEVVLILGDIIEDKVYGQLVIPVSGIGRSEEKAYIAAFKKIQPKNNEITSFLQDGKNKIMLFYKTHCEEIVAEAQKQALLQNYEDALVLLASVPDVCTECLEKSALLTETVYDQMIDARGLELLNEARTIWASNPSKQGALEATQILSRVNFAASCQPDVNALLAVITEKMNEIDQREWQHQMRIYNDNINREKAEWKQHVREYEDRVKTQRMYINACRDVAMSYAKNQPKIINYNRILLW